MTLPSYAICTAEIEVEGVNRYKAQLAELSDQLVRPAQQCASASSYRTGVYALRWLSCTQLRLYRLNLTFVKSCPCLLIFQAKAEFDVWIRKLDHYPMFLVTPLCGAWHLTSFQQDSCWSCVYKLFGGLSNQITLTSTGHVKLCLQPDLWLLCSKKLCKFGNGRQT